MGLLGGRPLPMGYGELEPEIQAIRERCGLMTMEAWELLMLKGPESEVFFNGLASNDVSALPETDLQGNLLLDGRGRLHHLVEVARPKPGQLIISCEPGELAAVAAHLERYHIRESLQIGQVQLLRMDLMGPGIGSALSAVGLDPDQALGEFEGAPLICLRHPVKSLPRRSLMLPPDSASDLMRRLLYSESGVSMVGLDAFDEMRILSGQPRMGVEIQPGLLPAEAGILHAVSFTKGCYVGQESVARLKYRGSPNQQLQAFRVPSEGSRGLKTGADLYLLDQTVGEVKSLTRLSHNGFHHGIAMTRLKLLEDQRQVALEANGETVVDLRPLATMEAGGLA